MISSEFSPTVTTSIPLSISSATLTYNSSTYGHVTINTAYTNQIAGSSQWSVTTNALAGKQYFEEKTLISSQGRIYTGLIIAITIYRVSPHIT
jgi:hypothetical protein